MTAFSFSAKLAPAKSERSAANSSARAGGTAESRMRAIGIARIARVIAADLALTHQALRAWSPLSRIAGEGVQRSDAGKGATAAPAINQSVYFGAVQLPQTQG